MSDLIKDGKTSIFCHYITKNGRRIYPKHGKLFYFVVNKENTK